MNDYFLPQTLSWDFWKSHSSGFLCLWLLCLDDWATGNGPSPETTLRNKKQWTYRDFSLVLTSCWHPANNIKLGRQDIQELQAVSLWFLRTTPFRTIALWVHFSPDFLSGSHYGHIFPNLNFAETQPVIISLRPFNWNTAVVMFSSSCLSFRTAAYHSNKEHHPSKQLRC